MALVDPYSPCPCGSGQKYKWCCQKVEAYAERAQRLVDNGQYESALKPLDEGLAKVPDNRLAPDAQGPGPAPAQPARRRQAALRALLQKHPDHLSGIDPLDAAGAGNRGPDRGRRPVPASALGRPRRSSGRSSHRWPHSSASSLAQAGFSAAALKHLELAVRLGGRRRQADVASLQRSSRTRRFPSGRRIPIVSGRPPSRLSEPFRESFERALGWADEGLWSSAASAFELLAAGSGAGHVADRNRGLCCLWLADHDGAVAALRRYIARTGPTIDAVDLEALCQRIDEPPAARSRRIRAPDLADPEPRRAAGGPASRPDLERRPRSTPRSRRSRSRPRSSGSSCSIVPDRGQARAHPPGDSRRSRARSWSARTPSS